MEPVDDRGLGRDAALWQYFVPVSTAQTSFPDETSPIVQIEELRSRMHIVLDPGGSPTRGNGYIWYALPHTQSSVQFALHNRLHTSERSILRITCSV